MKKRLLSLLLTSTALAASAETIGSVSTTFKLLSPNDKVVVDVFDDPGVGGVACYLSHAKTGGYAGAGAWQPTDPGQIGIYKKNRPVALVEYAQAAINS